MTVPLRWKIRLLAVLAPLALGLGTLWIVNHSVAKRARADIRQQLETAALVFRNVYGSRSRALEMAAEVIVRDPRFFSALTLPAGAGDRHFRATVSGVAHDFDRIARTDLFEVFDGRGRLLASVGSGVSSPRPRRELVREALRGRSVSGLLVERGAHYQVTVRPTRVDGRTVGAVMLGTRIGDELAGELRALTGGEITFLSGPIVTGSSLRAGGDRLALRRALDKGSESEVRLASGSYLTLVGPIPGSAPGSGQSYVLQRSLDVELAFLRELQGGLARIAILVVVVAIFIGFVVAREVVDPIGRLVRGAEEIERGNYDYPLEVRARDEIGYLTERFRHMREQERAYVGSLEEVARLKSQFISVASHELRTPVTIIKCYSEMLADGTLGPVTPDQRQALETIEGGLGAIVRITEDATLLAQMESERPTLTLEEHEIAAVVEAAMNAAVAEAVGRSVAVDVAVEPGLRPARLDGPRISHAIANLIRNAIRFTPDGGSVTVRARGERSQLVIEIQDTGIGIPEDKRERLFDRSFMLRDPRHHHSSRTLEFNSAGLGLGLPIAGGIVEAHGGTIVAESQVGRGSTFTIRVPVEFIKPQNRRSRTGAPAGAPREPELSGVAEPVDYEKRSKAA